jgi:hypothetical protein
MAFGSGAICCSAVAASVTASQSEGGQALWAAAVRKVGAAAQVMKTGRAKVGNFMAKCTGTVCHMITGNTPLLPHPVKARSVDDFAPGQVDDMVKVMRRELEFQEDEALLY